MNNIYKLVTKPSNNKHDWTLGMFRITIKHKNSCETKIFYYMCKILFSPTHQKC